MIKIAVRCPNWVGDTIMATPVLALLRDSFTGARITAIGRPSARAVLENNPHIDSLWIVRDKSLGDMLKLVSRIRRERFDLAALLPNSFRSALEFALGRTPKRIGYAMDRRSLLLTNPVEVTEFHCQCHQVEYYMNVLADLDACNVEQAERRLILRPTEEARREIGDLLRREGIHENRPIAAISPGAAFGSSKCWLPERFAQIADYLGQRYLAQTLIVGAPDEEPLCREIAQLARQPVFAIGSKVSLGGLIALCEKLDMMVTNDCGAMHVAAAMRVPLVAIFGPTDPRRTRPYDPEASVVEDIKGCGCEIAPCYKKICPIDHRCMKAVSVPDVEEAIERQMRRAARRAGGRTE
ncbi:MAG: ADP-heptose--LPS heptosyltransferase 2 [candidate division BRC1 bacterium ADurb.BinA364]|nr:MAG: ADP-heptose--LPS heptosyltransferase 2 [candidate division BRC1 bacterium ADurb.BinA364]